MSNTSTPNASPAPGSPGARLRIRQVKTWAAIAALVVSVLFLAVTAGVVLTMRQRVLDDKKLQFRNLALVLAEQIDRSFQSIELVQQAVTDDIARLNIQNTADFKQALSSRSFHEHLQTRTIGLPHLTGLTIRTADGVLINSSFGWPSGDSRLSPNPGDFFANHPDAIVSIGKPTFNSRTKKFNIVISRRLSLPDGQLAGYVNGTTELEYFENYFQTISLGEHSAIALLREDGLLLVRYPRQNDLIGTTIVPVKQNVIPYFSTEVRHTSPIDGQDKLLAGHKLAHYPVHVIVTSTVTEALTLWRQTTLSIVFAGMAVLMMVAMAALFSIRRFAHLINTNSAHFTSAVNNMSKGLVIMDENRKVVVCNDSYARMYGLPPRLVQPGTPLRDIAEFRVGNGTLKSNPDTFIEDVLQRMNGSRDEYLSYALGGRLIRVVNEPIPGSGYLSTHEDITDARMREESLKLLFANNPISMWVYDQKTLDFIAVNDAAIAQYGHSREEFLRLKLSEIRPAEDREHFLESVHGINMSAMQALDPNKSDRGVWRHMRKDGSTFEVHIYSHALLYEGHASMLVAAVDVTEQREAERRIAYFANHDKLTDLPNRSAFDEHFVATIAQAKENGRRIAVMCLDLDGFKQVNDFKGHSTGDIVLREIAARLRHASEDAYLARFGGDEFTVICTDTEDGSVSKAVAERLIAAVHQDLYVEGHRVTVGLSIGIALFPSHGEDAETLLVNADLALYRAKKQQRGTAQYFNTEMDAMVRQRRAMQEELHRAIAANELSLHYQPQVSMQREIVGYEALVRWNSAKYGNVSPGTFIPLAEETDLIIEISDWILREACREAASWPGKEKIAVNISPRQFQQVELPQLVQQVLIETGLTPSRLELEITEGVLIEDFSRAQMVLRRLKNIGVYIALDDFGTGYSSLSYLHSFPFDCIKIDRAFISDLEESRHSRAIVRAVIGLGQSLNIPILAEGVETEAQFAFLRYENCHLVQGYLTGRPGPASQLHWKQPQAVAS
jgi:diguanylate cyclase (GGDEF)-like protein/PAS domain S-box-containing protein